MSNNNKISSLDSLFESIYASKFSEWLTDKVLKSIVKKNEWHIKSSDLAIQLIFVRDKNEAYNFIKGRFHIGLIYVSSPEDAQEYVFDLEDYSYKPNLIGTIQTRIVKEDEDVYFDLSYCFNFFPELDLVDYFNRLYDQIETIKDDIRYRLGVDLLESINVYNEELNKDNKKFIPCDKEEEEEEDNNEGPGKDKIVISPYDIGEDN